MAYKLDADLIRQYEAAVEALAKLSAPSSSLATPTARESFSLCVESLMGMVVNANLIADEIANSNDSTFVKLSKFSNIASKMINLLSKVQGTAYEWKAYAKYLKKNREVDPDVDNVVDPDLRVWDEDSKYEKVIELKTVTTNSPGMLKERVTAQLASALEQISKRDFVHKDALDRKFKIAIEINGSGVASMLQGTGLFPPPEFEASAVYAFFADIVKKAILRKGITPDMRSKIFKSAWTSKVYKHDVQADSRRILSSTHEQMLQIDFKFSVPVAVKRHIRHFKTSKLALMIYGKKLATVSRKDELRIHETAYFTDTRPSAGRVAYSNSDGPVVLVFV
ncbi:hypothetical protein F0U62_35085 [Cystobacter fuscus]|uniref:hypothetical protein n=1 Tax=Cystobacter fuscus TaxID=43 RepID=UPI002B30FF38|nr:hypothetical protein F0U62_35085 [Cystobacter fuscus]